MCTQEKICRIKLYSAKRKRLEVLKGSLKGLQRLIDKTKKKERKKKKQSRNKWNKRITTDYGLAHYSVDRVFIAKECFIIIVHC